MLKILTNYALTKMLKIYSKFNIKNLTNFINFRTSLMDGSGSLEEQFEVLCHKANEIRARRGDLKKIEELGAILEEHSTLR